MATTDYLSLLFDFPHELIMDIAELLLAKDVLSWSYTCKYFHKLLACNEKYWRRRFTYWNSLPETLWKNGSPFYPSLSSVPPAVMQKINAQYYSLSNYRITVLSSEQFDPLVPVVSSTDGVEKWSGLICDLIFRGQTRHAAGLMAKVPPFGRAKTYIEYKEYKIVLQWLLLAGGGPLADYIISMLFASGSESVDTFASSFWNQLINHANKFLDEARDETTQRGEFLFYYQYSLMSRPASIHAELCMYIYYYFEPLLEHKDEFLNKVSGEYMLATDNIFGIDDKTRWFDSPKIIDSIIKQNKIALFEYYMDQPKLDHGGRMETCMLVSVNRRSCPDIWAKIDPNGEIMVSKLKSSRTRRGKRTGRTSKDAAAKAYALESLDDIQYLFNLNRTYGFGDDAIKYWKAFADLISLRLAHIYLHNTRVAVGQIPLIYAVIKKYKTQLPSKLVAAKLREFMCIADPTTQDILYKFDQLVLINHDPIPITKVTNIYQLIYWLEINYPNSDYSLVDQKPDYYTKGRVGNKTWIDVNTTKHNIIIDSPKYPIVCFTAVGKFTNCRLTNSKLNAAENILIMGTCRCIKINQTIESGVQIVGIHHVPLGDCLAMPL